ncbi:DUF6519 domain-containing protein [Specibacter cremeus]|uniref:DUF6519 domain-containing protein n=1 Tax=Specibacter cremeus TaxID=1629051 RepID=UPI000F77265B|nr:DUF6519 domain-containing protein [Specibacter cremeus]
MKGDFSRDTFDPANHYTRVLIQQGRVQLDADLNEQAAITRHHLQTLAADLIGPHGGPVADLGFAVITDPKDVAALSDAYGRPLDPALLARLQNGLGRGDFVIGTGRYYVAGALCENDTPLLYSDQAGYPFDAASTPDALRGAGEFLIYLDVWERHLGYAEAAELREVALGGPDTAGRAQLSWQVRILVVGSTGVGSTGQAAAPAALAALAPPTVASLRARAKAPDTSTDACQIDPAASYRGLENQLYRVEVHDPGTAAGGATFKWSRENGSVVMGLAGPPAVDAAANTTTVELLTLGRDENLGLVVGGWVELVDDGYTIRHDAAALLRVHSIEPDSLTVLLEGAPAAGVGVDDTAHPLLRRWDQGDGAGPDGTVAIVESADPTTGWLDLEDGVQVQFVPGFLPGGTNTYRTGDYWLIPARTATGDVDWPGEAALAPQALPPHGETHDYAPLAAGSINADGMLTLTAPDLRRRFGPLAQ